MPFPDSKYPHDQRLVKAAPELLATCKWLLDEVCRSRYGYKMHPDDRIELMGKLLEVIAKAEGDTHTHN